jgi:xylulose-5-phosphate/fructose-6-phosphate phosphoketolase
MIRTSAPVTAAIDYWRACCAVAAAHAFGLPWPPEECGPIRAPAGHWGANPGIALIVAHIAAQCEDGAPVRLVLGTGHAGSFVLAHEFVAGNVSVSRLNEHIHGLGQPGGVSTEVLDWPRDLPHLFGELGTATAVAQGLAAAASALIVCIIGDGECETPATLAALAHGELVPPCRGAGLLLAINANAARMGGAARFGPARLERILLACGYEVVTSCQDHISASAAAMRALCSARLGRRVAWISVTEKGWPAPATLEGKAFRGAVAHKPPALRTDGPGIAAMASFAAEFSAGKFLANGAPAPPLALTASRATFGTTSYADPPSRLAIPTATAAPGARWASPMEAIDQVAVATGMRIFSPDEARSNLLVRSLAAGLVTEVLAEEVCLGWTIGHVAGGRPAAFASYEAFAPLVSSQLAQYAKLIRAQPMADRPPLALVLTSLGWANSPTHRNADITSTFLARGSSRFRLICPIGRASTHRRFDDALRNTPGGAFALLCSKQCLPDVPDAEGAVVRLSCAQSSEAIIYACGDYCVAEAVGAIALASAHGKTIEVWAIIEPTALTRLVPGCLTPGARPTIASVHCSASIIAGPLWKAAGVMMPIRGSDGDLSGVTPWERLIEAGQDRWSLLAALFPELPARRPTYAEAVGSVIPAIDLPPLSASPHPALARGEIA